LDVADIASQTVPPGEFPELDGIPALAEAEYSDEEVPFSEIGAQTPASAFQREPEPEPEPEPESEPEPVVQEEPVVHEEPQPEEQAPAEPEEEEPVFIRPIPDLKPAPAPPARQLDEDEQAQAARLFITRGFIPPPPDRCSVFQYIQKQMVNAAVAGKYKEADRYWAASQRFIEACHQSNARDVKDDAADINEARQSEAERDLAKITKKWNRRIAELTAQFAERLEIARKEHEQKLAEFDLFWRNPENLRPYCKMSGPLVELKQIEKKTVLARMYKAARVYQARANALQEEETHEAQRNARSDILAKRTVILQNYQEQVSRIKTYRDKLIMGLERKKSEEENGMQIRLAHLQLQHDRIKAKRPASVTFPKQISSGEATNVVGVRSPRTRETYNTYRKAVKVKKLPVRTYSAFRPIRGAPHLLPRPPRPEEEEDLEV
jgi:hypothetical protein